MANQLSNTVGLLVNNANPLPDAVTESAFPINVIAATGTTQATAAPLTSNLTAISNNTAANGVVLPVGNVQQKMYIYPQLITNAPLLYPPVGGTINFGTINAGVAITARKLTEALAIDNTGLNWIVMTGA